MWRKVQVKKSVTQKSSRGRPKKWEWLEELARQIIVAKAVRTYVAEQEVLRSRYTDAEMAEIVWNRAKTIMSMNDDELRQAMLTERPGHDWIRRRRQEVGVLPAPRGGHRDNAGRPKGSKSASASQRQKKPLRRLVISREALVHWNAQEYEWDAEHRRYVCRMEYIWDEKHGRYVRAKGKEVERPVDLPATLPSWGGGSGLPWLGLTKASGQEWDAIQRGRK